MTETNISEESQVAEPTADERADRVRPVTYTGTRPFVFRTGYPRIMPGDEIDEAHPYAKLKPALLERTDFEEQ